MKKKTTAGLLLTLALLFSLFSSTACGQFSAETLSGDQSQEGASKIVSMEEIPDYSGKPYCEVNGNVPEFAEEDMTGEAFETYSSLDNLQRCGEAYAEIGTELMPLEERGSIGQVKPTGWHTVKYDFVDGKYLYNRCHLIGYQLSGENANEENLITGTRYMNVEGMLPFENMV
ncbi:MAG: DNA/RNA non-specific endonuclease, partial [Anaerovoracaceae bacterium]